VSGTFTQKAIYITIHQPDVSTPLRFAQHDNFTQGMRKIVIFRRKTGILVALRRFLGKIREELNNEYRLLNIEYRGKKWGNNKTANKFISELVH
jgi:hypothetical protein